MKLTPAERFIKASMEHGEESDSNPKRANKAYDEKIKALCELRKSDDLGKAALLTLLDHSSPFVRCSAAVYLLELEPVKAAKVLKAIDKDSKVDWVARVDAHMVLREWKVGRLKLPFGRNGEYLPIKPPPKGIWRTKRKCGTSLLEQFTKASLRYGEGMESHNSKKIEWAKDNMDEASRELWKSYDHGKAALIPLLDHPSPHVRRSAAIYLLALEPVKAAKALETIANERLGFVSLLSETTLIDWRAGRLTMPFGTNGEYIPIIEPPKESYSNQ
ncbi:MAG: DUF2019 domain-containing protein [SAR202 cluster bacterium]|nr:DUF2019 domain-containing protein [SAR202 cluster bacterium]